MNDLIMVLIEMKKDLGILSEQIYGASKMINNNSPHYEFMKYVQYAVDGFHDKLGFQLKVSGEKPAPLNCS